LKALEVYKNWNKETEEKIEKALGNGPDADMDFRNAKLFTKRRSYAVLEKSIL